MTTQNDESKDQTSIPDLAPTPPKKKSDAVVIDSPHLFNLTAQALADRKEVLAKLAKDARGEGYIRQATDIEADAAAIEFVLLPQFRMQREFPLVDGEKFEKACADAMRGLISKAFAGMDDPKQKFTPDAITRRKETLMRDVGARVATFAREVASSAYVHGYHVRTTGADVIAASALQSLGGNGRAD
jgi:hypothetical protein